MFRCLVLDELASIEICGYIANIKTREYVQNYIRVNKSSNQLKSENVNVTMDDIIIVL